MIRTRAAKEASTVPSSAWVSFYLLISLLTLLLANELCISKLTRVSFHLASNKTVQLEVQTHRHTLGLVAIRN